MYVFSECNHWSPCNHVVDCMYEAWTSGVIPTSSLPGWLCALFPVLLNNHPHVLYCFSNTHTFNMHAHTERLYTRDECITVDEIQTFLR